MLEYIIKKELEKAVKVNICVPQTESSVLFNKMYKNAAMKFLRIAETKLLAKARRASNEELPYSAVMRYLCPFESERELSVIVDAFFYDGKQRAVMRFPLVWDKQSDTVNTFSDYFTLKDKKRIIETIVEQARSMQEKRMASFYADCEKLIRRRFDERQFCLTDNGYLFFYAAGVLTASNRPYTFRLDRFDAQR